MPQPFVGIQLGAHSVYDEGVDRVLDTLQTKARVNAVVVATHAFSWSAQNHLANPGQPWVRSHEEHYVETFLRHVASAKVHLDVLDDLADPAATRGIQVYARMLEGYGGWLAGTIDNWPKILTVDIYGRRGSLPCWNNPDYRTWLISTAGDVVAHHAISGYMYGSERSGPLSHLLTNGQTPGCFCTHCQNVGRRRGIDVGRAIAGFTKLDELAAKRRADDRPLDGYLVTFLRILLRYPEVLRWEYEWHLAKEAVAREMYGAVKAIRPETEVGWHVYHAVTWDPVYQAETDYADMTSYSDWVKPVVYPDIQGIRIRNHYVAMTENMFGELTPSTLRTFLFEILGYDPGIEPSLDDMPTQGMSPEYVWREVRRCVLAVAGRIPVYAGVGFDIPTDGDPIRSTPDKVYRSVRRSFEAGAAGLLVSREYDEMRSENLEAVGRAVDDAMADGLVPGAEKTTGR